MIIDSDTFYSTDILIVDIDDTLIYGRFVEFMDLTWRLFKSPFIAKLLCQIQQKLQFYKVNHKVAEAIVTAGLNESEVIILTARSYTQATIDLIFDIIPNAKDINLRVVQLASRDPSRDKFEYIQSHTKEGINKITLLDDNLRTRLKCMELPYVQAIHPGDIING